MTLASRSAEPIEDSRSFVVIVRRERDARKSAYGIYNSDRRPPSAAEEVFDPTFISPIPAFQSYCGVIAWRWLMLASGCIAVAWLVRARLANAARR